MDKPPRQLGLREIDWNDFKTGGYEGTGKKSWQPPKVIDQRDNEEEIKISNLYAAHFRALQANKEVEASLSEERRLEVLKALEAMAQSGVATTPLSWEELGKRASK